MKWLKSILSKKPQRALGAPPNKDGKLSVTPKDERTNTPSQLAQSGTFQGIDTLIALPVPKSFPAVEHRLSRLSVVERDEEFARTARDDFEPTSPPLKSVSVALPTKGPVREFRVEYEDRYTSGIKTNIVRIKLSEKIRCSCVSAGKEHSRFECNQPPEEYRFDITITCPACSASLTKPVSIPQVHLFQYGDLLDHIEISAESIEMLSPEQRALLQHAAHQKRK
jgi:hypothetical protein